MINHQNEYLGHIQFQRFSNVLVISGSESISKGTKLYLKLFPGIFKDGITEILSDNDLSRGALKSYLNLKKYFKIQLFDGKTYSKIENLNIYDHKHTRISVKLK